MALRISPKPNRWIYFTDLEIAGLLFAVNSINGDLYNDFGIARELAAEQKRRKADEMRWIEYEFAKKAQDECDRWGHRHKEYLRHAGRTIFLCEDCAKEYDDLREQRLADAT